MADKDLSLEIGVELDEKSAERAGKDAREGIEKGIGNNGRVKVSVDLEIEGASKKLKKAQKELVTQIEKITSEGFSASKKDIKMLNELTKRFTQQATKERDYSER